MLLSGFRCTELFNVLSTALGRGTRSIEHPQAHQTLPERGRERQNKKKIIEKSDVALSCHTAPSQNVKSTSCKYFAQ